MVAVFSDEVTKASTEVEEYLENQVSAIAPLPGFRRGHGENAVTAANKVAQHSALSTQEILQVAILVQKQKKDLSRKEFGSFVRDILGWTSETATKYLNVAKTYGNFPSLEVLSQIEPFMLWRLCGKRYAEVVEQLREREQITQKYVIDLIDKIVPKILKKKKQSTDYGDAVLQRHPNTKDGTFYFTLKEVNLSDEAGLWLEEKLVTQTVGQILQQARERELAIPRQPPSDYRLAQLEELDQVIADAREQREIARKATLEQRRAEERETAALQRAHLAEERSRLLEQQLAELEHRVENTTSVGVSKLEIVAHVEAEPELEAELGVQENFQPSHDFLVPLPDALAGQLLHCASWTEVQKAIDRVAEATGVERGTVFVQAVKHINPERRSHLIELLAAHIQEFPRDHWAYSWLPEAVQKLKNKAIALAT